MRIGLFGLGVEPLAGPKWIAEVAQAAERRGFSSLYSGTHHALFDSYESEYPYLPGGKFPMPSSAHMYDALVLLPWIAAHTETIRIGTAVSLPPLLNPVVAAKQIGTIDELCGGRMVYGVGVGWCHEEYQAVGIPWDGRWGRMDDTIAAMRSLWTSSEQPSTYQGKYSSHEGAHSYPKPLAREEMPVFYGGNGEYTLRRAGRNGQGWIGMNLTPEETTERVSKIHKYAEEAGRDPNAIELMIMTSDWPKHTVDDLKGFRDAGVSEMLEMGFSQPRENDDAAAWIDAIARETVDKVQGI